MTDVPQFTTKITESSKTIKLSTLPEVSKITNFNVTQKAVVTETKSNNNIKSSVSTTDTQKTVTTSLPQSTSTQVTQSSKTVTTSNLFGIDRLTSTAVTDIVPVAKTKNNNNVKSSSATTNKPTTVMTDVPQFTTKITESDKTVKLSTLPEVSKITNFNVTQKAVVTETKSNNNIKSSVSTTDTQKTVSTGVSQSTSTFSPTYLNVSKVNATILPVKVFNVPSIPLVSYISYVSDIDKKNSIDDFGTGSPSAEFQISEVYLNLMSSINM
jgi:hypothetical protein